MDHRLVIDRQQLLAHALGDRPEPGAGTTGEDDSLHSGTISILAVARCEDHPQRVLVNGNRTAPFVERRLLLRGVLKNLMGRLSLLT